MATAARTMRTVLAGSYVRSMQAMRRATGPDRGTILDAGIAVVGVGLTAVAAWSPPSRVLPAVAGPPWLLAVLPLLIGAPLAWRRRAPLLMWAVIWAGISLQALITRVPLQGFALTYVLVAGSYSVGAHSGWRRAPAALAVTAAGALIYILASHEPVRGISHNVSLSFVPEILVCWLAGVFVRARSQAASLAISNAALQRQAEQAVAAERARIARELHDIVAHHLSVVILQAAGARASDAPAAGTLEKIEHSGRQALTEMRRLLDVLREPDEEPGLAPQPGIGELAALADSVRAAGLPVRLLVDGDHAALPAAVDVSAYRIVQEALTNVLKHAGPARAEVVIGCADGQVTIEVTDDGTGNPPTRGQAGGRGLAGMRERVAIFGGQLEAGPLPGGGYAIKARLPLDGVPP